MTKAKLFLISALLFVFIIGANRVNSADQSEGNTKITVGELLTKADSVFKSRDYLKSRELYQLAADAAKTAGDNSSQTEAQAMIARTYLILDEKEEGRQILARAEKTATPDQPLGWSRYLGVRGRFEWQDKELAKAMATFEEMYEYCTQHKLHERAVDAAHMVAITGTPEQQIEWGKKGITQAETGGVTGWLGPLWNNLGATYEELDRFDESLAAYLKAREYHWRYGNERNKLVADWAVGHMYRLTGDAAKAGQWLRPVLAWCERIGEEEFLGLTCRDLGEIELTNNHEATALDYLRRARDKLKQVGMPDWDAEGYQKLSGQIVELESKVDK